MGLLGTGRRLFSIYAESRAASKAIRFRPGGKYKFESSSAVAKRYARRESAFAFIGEQLIQNAIQNWQQDNQWEQYYTEIIASQVDKAGNEGQVTILTDYFPGPAQTYCAEHQDDFDPDNFILYVKLEMGSYYSDAITIIIEECANELYDAWGFIFENKGGFRRGIYGTFEQALSRYQGLAAHNWSTKYAKYANRGIAWNSVEAANIRSAAAARNFLSTNPGGTARPSLVTPEYRAAALRNGKVLR